MFAFLPLQLALTASAVPLAEATGVVDSVQVRGTARVEAASVLHAVHLSPGDRLTRVRARRDIKSIYDTGLFDDVRLELDRTVRGVRLTFVVRERPAVGEVSVTGLHKLNEDDVMELINAESWTVHSTRRTRQIAERIRAHGVEEGLLLVDVGTVVEPVVDGLVDVQFRVTEHHKVRVHEVVLAGAKTVSRKILRRYLQNREPGPLALLGAGGSYDPELLEADRQALRYALWEHGLVEAVVHRPEVWLSPDKRRIHIRYRIEEGQPYQVGHVDITGDLMPDLGLGEDDVRAVIAGTPTASVQDAQWRLANNRRPRTRNAVGPRLSAGDAFKASTMWQVATAVQGLYQDQGYAYAQVTPEPLPDPGRGAADILLHVDAGQRYELGEIQFQGNDPTLDRVLRRELRVNEGDTWRGGHLQASAARIQRLGYFEAVEITPSRPAGGGDDNVLDAVIRVTEQPTGSFNLGLGLAGEQGVTFSGGMQKSNLLGMGLGFAANADINKIRAQARISIYEPHLLDSAWTVQTSAWWNNDRSPTQQLKELRRGLTFELGRHLDRNDNVRAALRYTYEDVRLSDLDPFRQRLLGGELYRDGTTSTLSASVTVDRRDNRVNPTRGIYASVNASLSGGFRGSKHQIASILGGDFNRWELTGTLRAYRPIIGPDKLVARLQTTVGITDTTDGSVVPWQHRYRVGGMMSVRGYPWHSLGPTLSGAGSDDPTAPDRNIVVGGTQMWVSNFELEAPIVRSAGISAVAFFDVGNSFGDPWGSQGLELLDMRSSVGAGLRWKSPMGLIRLEYAVPLTPRPGDKKGRLDFTIGTSF